MLISGVLPGNENEMMCFPSPHLVQTVHCINEKIGLVHCRLTTNKLLTPQFSFNPALSLSVASPAYALLLCTIKYKRLRTCSCRTRFSLVPPALGLARVDFQQLANQRTYRTRGIRSYRSYCIDVISL